MNELGINREQKNIVRGYDTQGLFWQDVLLRTRQVQTKPEVPRPYVDITGLLVEIARREAWYSQS
jgi:hypothetical protein